MLFRILTLFYLIHEVNGASPDGIWLPPLNNLTALNKEHAPIWVAQPPYRGTWGILYSCTITLGLCVYTAIHINVPAPNDSQTKIWIRKIKWMLLALIAPEFVVSTAWLQFVSARNIHKKLNEHVMQQENNRRKEGQYDLMMGYYIAMGGCSTRLQHGALLQDNNERGLTRTLTPEDMVELAVNDVFIRVDPKQIEDKSKADILAKFLVCFQVFWMLVETSARKLSGYPLALLEVHVFVHVVCALMMYALWFKKPVDVRHAVDVTDQIPQDLRTKVQSDLLRVNNLAVPSTWRNASWSLDVIMSGSIILMNAMYGGAHLSTWNFDFPTNIERMLWKTSCIITLCGCLVAPGYLIWGDFALDGSGIIVTTLSLFTGEFINEENDGEDSNALLYLVNAIVVISILALPIMLAARIFLVVESFISLRDVPTGVYATVPWAQYIPHI
ncbi:hypothetical protein BZA77DRAFT_253280 [Pyronema omphalodes]|nr:hypothetical protein BZA77DRAFT_253280 [Pyronema omphalodes]